MLEAMSQLAKFGVAIGWLMSLLVQFFKVRWTLATTVIVYSVIARITRMLTFLLPLKIILLAGSDGVPRYFQIFLSPEHKSEGVIVLSVAAIAFYAVSLVLEARIKRLSERGSAELLAESGVMAVVANQRDQAKGFYARITQIAADLVFCLVGFTVLAVIDPVLVIWLASLTAIFIGMTAGALNRATSLRSNWLANAISDRLSSYLGVLSSIAFLSSFLVLLYPYLIGEDRNILLAIISVVLMRRLLGALTGSIKDMAALAAQRELVDTLVFPERRLEVSERKDQRSFRELFGRGARERLIASEMAEFLGQDVVPQVAWQDPPRRGLSEFAITLGDVDGAKRYLLQWVYPPRLRHLLENEELLFRHIDRAEIGAPPVIRNYLHGENECVVYDLGQKAAVGSHPSMLLTKLWSIEPPPALVKIHAASHLYLHERLSDDFVSRLDIAISTDAEAALFAKFRESVDALRRRVAVLPLCIIIPNPVVRRGSALGWGNWSLEPAGVGIGKLIADSKALEDLVGVVGGNRRAFQTETVSARSLILVERCSQLERAVLQGKLKSGLRTAAQILHDLKAYELA